ncbi:MAG: polysaccharide biosynthesis protein [Alphaproteobacteria bacterium]|nr:polysaccharide biosynthesis protein [Alphaproteobacteria bacterium]
MADPEKIHSITKQVSPWLFFSWRSLVAALHDAGMAALAFVLALYLRLGDEQFHLATPYLLPGMLMFTALSSLVFARMRLYRGLWRYASLPDLVAITKAVTIAVVVFTVLMFALTRLEGIPRSLPFILWLLLLALLGGPRFLYRAVKDRTLAFHFTHDASRQIPLLLAGATGSAELFIRECTRNPASPYRVVGILDEDPSRRHRELLGVRIYGGAQEMASVVHALERKGLKPQRLILAEEDPTGKKTRQLLELADPLGLGMGRLPSLNEFKHGAEKQEIRPIAIEDLLGRAQNVHDKSVVAALVSGRRVAITGAGGSIGSELARQIAGFSPTRLLLVELSEFALYSIDQELGEIHPGVPRRAVLADVRDAPHIEALFAEEKPELVFHAAALKHVPLSEANPIEAITTNVFGTCHVADAALAHGAAAMVLISTDKAVHPANIMGATKRLSEAYTQALGSHGQGPTRFFTVRFGNVLGSTGSVVPLFQKQLQRGGPITVTHADMVRYFMTIREAVELVLQAAALGLEMQARREAIFVLDMGTPVRITDLATQMIRLAGLRPGQDIAIRYTGLRPGEKLFEELFYDEEGVTRTSRSGILLAAARDVAFAPLHKSLARLKERCRERDVSGAVRLLATLVPEYRPNP